MKRILAALLCTAAALLLSACRGKQSDSSSETAVETAETAAETFPKETAPAETVTTVPAYAPPTDEEIEQALRDAEAKAKQEVLLEKFPQEYEEKHAAYLNGQGFSVEDAVQWREGYAAFLESGEYVYALNGTAQLGYAYSYALLHIDDSDVPNLAVCCSIQSGMHYTDKILFFRYRDGCVYYLDSCGVDQYDYAFCYRPYRGGIAYADGSVMTSGRCCYVWQIGGETRWRIPFGYPPDEELAPPPETAEQLDVKSQPWGLGASWVSVSTDSSIFKPITQETIGQLQN